MKKVWKKTVCIGLVATMTISLTACFGNRNGDGSQAVALAADAQAAKEAVFRESGTLELPEDYLNYIGYHNDEIVMISTTYMDSGVGDFYGEEVVPYIEEIMPEVETTVTTENSSESAGEVNEELSEESSEEVSEGSGEEPGVENGVMIPVMPEVGMEEGEYHFWYDVTVHKATFGGEVNSTVTFSLEQDEYLSRTFVNEGDGNLVFITEKDVSDWSDPDNYVWEQFYYINVYSPQGEFIAREEFAHNTNDGEYFYPSGVTGDEQGNIYIGFERGIWVYDSNLQKIAEIEVPEGNWLENMLTTWEGAVYAYIWTEGTEKSSNNFYEVNLATKTLGSPVPAPENFWGEVRSGQGHDLYYSTDKGVYIYDFDTLEDKLIFDYIDSDIDYSQMGRVIPIDETRIIATMYNTQDWSEYISFLEKVPPEEVVDKEIITIGMLYMDYDIRSKVIEFNKASAEYRIRMIEYYEYNTDEDENGGVRMLNNDIITSNAPDIIVINNEMPVQSFMEKGALLNLNSLIEADKEISKEDMAANVLALGSIEDDTYIMTASFAVATIAMKESLVPDNGRISLDELQSLERQFGDIKAFQDFTRQNIINFAMEMNYDEFMNPTEGTCNFNSPEFCALLEYAKQYPEEIVYEDWGESDWIDMEYAYRENRALMTYQHLGGFYGISYMDQGSFGEEIAFVGFPGSIGSGCSIYPYMQLAISADCEHPEVAWEFMRQFYTYEYQTNGYLYGFPVNLDAIDELMEASTQRPYWTDEEGNKVEYDDYYYIGDQEIKLEPLTQERAQEIRDYVLSADKEYYYDSAIVDIIMEEAAPFFAGQKTAQQAADIIQSRVDIYVKENM